MPSGRKLDTLLIHGGGRAPVQRGRPTSEPIVQNTAFAYDTAEDLADVFAGAAPGHVYSRISNPTVFALERRMAALEQGLGAQACASGMAAITAVVMALCAKDDEVVAAPDLFGGTRSLLASTLSGFGVRARFVSMHDPDAVRDAITGRTRMVFVETISNPKLAVADLAVLAEIATEKGVPLVVDSTVTTPVLVQPVTLGAHVIIHSASKFINGHGTAIGGVIVDAGTFEWASNPNLEVLASKAGSMAFLARLRGQICRDLGTCLSPFTAFLHVQGLESLAVRMERHCRNTMRIAESLAEDGRIEALIYPGLPDHPDHSRATRQFNGRYGAILTMRLGTRERCFQFINGLKLIQNLANLGDVRSLVIHPASTFCREATPEQQQEMGVTEDLVRLAIGIEDVDDLLEDVDQSLQLL